MSITIVLIDNQNDKLMFIRNANNKKIRKVNNFILERSSNLININTYLWLKITNQFLIFFSRKKIKYQ